MEFVVENPYYVIARAVSVSNSEAKRLIKQKAVKIKLDDEWLTLHEDCPYSPLAIWKVGKRRFFRLVKQ